MAATTPRRGEGVLVPPPLRAVPAAAGAAAAAIGSKRLGEEVEVVVEEAPGEGCADATMEASGLLRGGVEGVADGASLTVGVTALEAGEAGMAAGVESASAGTS